ncbi:amidohydrolase family protein [Kurthia sibirica]|uniref:Amidohydrolase n=1 Tax=Kurthia sibirica TaxID=202750 RepID=A0A2U3ANQ7_9BACL|nr:amidohydrolase family protein [Kurthia sibirica]PWI26139.1 amidohydrolase [Kurthia sibirica]GEK33396.1 hypothetical protein KSI01_09290 [Kurthia sibirica]
MFIIDVSNTLPQMQFGDVTEVEMKNVDYIQRHIPSWTKLAGWEATEFQRRLQSNSLKSVLIQLFKELDSIYSIENFRMLLKESNIQYHAIHNLDSDRSKNDKPVDHSEVATILATYPREFIGFAGFNPHKENSLQIVKHALTKQGYDAVVITPYDHGIAADDKRYYPLYEICEALEKPIWIHSSINYYKETSVFIDHPRHLEAPLMDFKCLKIIAGQGGWPWMEDLVMLLLKFDNLYIDSTALKPQHINVSASSLALFFQYANTSLQDQLLFGSNWLSKGIPIKELLEDIEKWPLEKEVKEKFYYKNAAKLFNLDIIHLK